MAGLRVALLSGEHPTLPEAELRALVAVHDPGAIVQVAGLLATIQPHNEAAADRALERMALAHSWGTPWTAQPDTDEGRGALAAAAHCQAPRAGRVAVEALQRGGGRSAHAMDVERRVGAGLKAAGWSIGLTRPDHTVFAWRIGDHWIVGLEGGRRDGDAFEARHVEERKHFSPVSLHPRLAAALVHLARVPPGGRILDPFCGTGGIVLEAALQGHDAWGSDLDPFMVQGTLEALADAGPEPLPGTVFQADIAAVPGLVEGVQGVVTDLPYGRASSTAREALGSLYERAAQACALVLGPGRRAVLGGPDPDLAATFARHGFTVQELHAQRVHRSLTRHFAVVMRADGVVAAP